MVAITILNASFNGTLATMFAMPVAKAQKAGNQRQHRDQASVAAQNVEGLALMGRPESSPSKIGQLMDP